ncbi:uncharacterized protein LOC130047758 [Ostrea edulis]|uniref:uncharacterized protein LOC130047758 n=1 Tax=Ostrea edulis TaxID=37623 RepID=UPI0020941115|nr:uncharacterized protein LOC130047758 [Ostrea edulis]
MLCRQFDNKMRGLEEVKKKYYNIKQRSKEKLDSVKKPKTGGGPPLPPLTPGEETFLNLSVGQPNVHGLNGGVDTDEQQILQSTPKSQEQAPCTSDSVSHQQPQENMASLTMNETSGHQCVISTSTTDRRKGKKVTDSKRKILEELEERNLSLDNKRLEEEILKVKEKREVLTLQKEVLQMKKQKLVFEIQANYPSFLEMEM